MEYGDENGPKMVIKTISDSEWEKLYLKPMIFIGFHPFSEVTLAIATTADEILMCSVIKGLHKEKQKFFKEIISKFPQAPIGYVYDKTALFLDKIVNFSCLYKNDIIFLLKGKPEETKIWKKEIELAIKSSTIKKNTKTQNPIDVLIFKDLRSTS